MALKKPRVEPDEPLDHAMWWVARWVSGSMGDPDWSWPEAEAITVEQAFSIVRDRIGNARASAGPFWRFLAVPEDEAARLLDGGDLLPHVRSTFQSFTSSEELAREFGEDAPGRGAVPLLVRVDVPVDCVMFGTEDLLADRRADDTMQTLYLWHHQGEIMVRVDAPLKVLEVLRLDTRMEPGPDHEADLDLGDEAGSGPRF